MHRRSDIHSACNRTTGPGYTGADTPAVPYPAAPDSPRRTLSCSFSTPYPHVHRKFPSGFILTILLLFLTAGFTLPAAGQGIADSVFAIREVAVTHSTTFLKEQAGMKRLTFDTLILRHQVHTDLSTLLAENSNIYIRDYGRGALATASFRGTAPSHTQVSWNGLNINSPMLGMVDFSLIPVFLIDELNIHHGAASVESRSGGLGGHIEIRSLPDWSNRSGGRIYAEYGSFNTAGGMAQFNLGSPNFQSATRLYYSGSENNYPFINKNIIEKDSATGKLIHPLLENRNAAYRKSGVSQEFYFRPPRRSGNRKSSPLHNSSVVDPIDHTSHPPSAGQHHSSTSTTPGTSGQHRSSTSTTPGTSSQHRSSTSTTPGTSDQHRSSTSTTPGTSGQHQPASPTGSENPGRVIISNKTWVQAADRSVPTVLSSEYTPGGLQRDNLQADRTIKNVTEYNFYGEQSKVRLRSGLDYQQLRYSMETEVPGLHRQKNVDSQSRMFSWHNSGALSHSFSNRFSANAHTAFNRYAIATFDSASSTGYDTIRLEGSLFGGLYLSATEQLMLSLQLRKDFVSDFRSPLIYTFGLNFRPFEKHDLVLQANVARNYHHPTLNDLYWQPGGNPGLRPEEGYTGEVSLLWSVSADKHSANTSLTGYYSQINDWILWLPGFKGYWEPVNLSEVRSYGLEYQLAANLTVRQTQIRLHGNFALTHTRDYSGTVPGGMVTGDLPGNDNGTMEADGLRGEQLPFIPRVSGNVFLSVTNRGWHLAWQYNAMGVRSLMNVSSNGLEDDSDILFGLNGGNGSSESSENNRLYSLYPLYMNNLRIGKGFECGSRKNNSWVPLQEVIVELRIDNLFNETYRNELQRFMPGRSYTINLKFEF